MKQKLFTATALSAASCALFLTLTGCDPAPSTETSPSAEATASAAAGTSAPVSGPTQPAEGTPAPPSQMPAGVAPFKGNGKVQKTASGLQYEDMTVGKGASPKTGQYVKVQYIGTLMDGTQFDASYDHGKPFEFPIGMGNVIKGWDEGVATMKVGGRRRLIVPSDLGYGPAGQGPIPPGATLVFDVALLGISDTPTQ